MADPITIFSTAGAAASIVAALGSTIEAFQKAFLEWKDADFTIHTWITQLTTLRAAVNKILEWLTGETELHHQLIMDLDGSLSCCQTMIRKMDSKLSYLGVNDSGLDNVGKIKLLFSSKSMDHLQRKIEQQINGLTLLLTACNCASVTEQKTELARSRTRKIIKGMQEDSSLYVHRDAASFRSYYTDTLSKWSRAFSFDNAILSSVVYQRVFRGLMKESFRQTQFKARSWKKNFEIEKSLRSSRQQSLQEIRILLAGDPETKQSTLANMLDAHGPVSIEDASGWRRRVKELSLMHLRSFFDCTASAEALPNSVDLDDNQTLYQRIAAYDWSRSDMGLASTVSDLLKTPQWRAIVKDPLDSLANALNFQYQPTHLDILKIRQTNQIDERRLEIGPSHYLFIDPVGDKYWNDTAYLERLLSPFEPALAIAFIVDLSSYDRESATEQPKNGLKLAFQNYDTLANSPSLSSKGSILLFIEGDNFANKLTTSPLKQQFPDFGEENDPEKAFDFVRCRFVDFNKNQADRVYSYVCNNDSKTMLKFIVETAQEIDMKESLKSNSRISSK